MIYFPIMIGSFRLCDAGSVLSWTCCGDGDVDDQATGNIFISKYPARSQPASNGWVFCSVGSTLCLVLLLTWLFIHYYWLE